MYVSVALSPNSNRNWNRDALAHKSKHRPAAKNERKNKTRNLKKKTPTTKTMSAKLQNVNESFSIACQSVPSISVDLVCWKFLMETEKTFTIWINMHLLQTKYPNHPLLLFNCFDLLNGKSARILCLMDLLMNCPNFCRTKRWFGQWITPVIWLLLTLNINKVLYTRCWPLRSSITC